MTPQERDAAYLEEFAGFSACGPMAVAESLFSAFERAHDRGDFERAAHLQVSLHSEMVRSLEMVGALLRSFSKWDHPGGISRALLYYKPAIIAEFMRQLKSSPEPLRLLCFPTVEAVKESAHPLDLETSTYTDAQLASAIADMVDLYLLDNVRNVHNKAKHAAGYVRHPQMLKPEQAKVIESDSVYAMLYDVKANSVEFVGLPVSSQKGIASAKLYLKNVRRAKERTVILARFVAWCLRAQKMTPSANDCRGSRGSTSGRLDEPQR